MDIINALGDVVGLENVTDDNDVLSTYSKDMSFVKDKYPRYVVRPQSSGEIQELVMFARKNNFTIIPVSSTGNHHNGDTVPTCENAIIIDFSRWKKIISQNRTHRMAIVEPAVTYAELIASLKKDNMTVSMPLRPRRNKSVLTSVLEVEPRINANHQWNYFEPLRCTEVTWGDGNNMFTGEAGGSPKDLKTQWEGQRWQINGQGPNAFDFIRMLTSAQGTMGIVTWASLKCEILPTTNRTYLVKSDSEKQLTKLANAIIKMRFSDSLFIVNGADASYLFADSPEEISQIRNQVGKWNMFIGISEKGLLPEQRFESQKKSIVDLVDSHGLTMINKVYKYDAQMLAKRFETPCEGKYWKELQKGAFSDIFFITTMGKTAEFIEKMKLIAKEEGYNTENIGIYIQPQNCGTSVHLEFTFPYDPDNEEEIELVKSVFEKGSKKMSEMDAYFSRPYGIWSQLQLSKDPVSYAVLEKLRNIFDPDNVLNRGKLTLKDEYRKGER